MNDTISGDKEVLFTDYESKNNLSCRYLISNVWLDNRNVVAEVREHMPKHVPYNGLMWGIRRAKLKTT